VIALAEDLARLKRQFLELLEKDKEFRHAVVGMLKFNRILRRLEKHDGKFEKLLESLNRHEAELVKLREDFNKIGLEIAKLREDMMLGFKRHDEELARLREDFNKLREDMIAGFRRHDEELAKLREDMNAGFKRHDEELAKLREDFNKMLSTIVQIQEEQRKLREGYERLEERVGSLEGGVVKLEERMGSLERGLKSLEGSMLKGFADLSKFAGVNFEDFVRSFLTEFLRRSGEIPEGAELKKAVVDGEEVNIFLEDPLIVGEVTAYADSVEEIVKLLRKAELVRAKYSREPRKIMVALNVKRDVVKEIERVAKERGVELMVGRAVD
jgi:predicted nuclease with TOPRIM domain